MLTQLVAFNVDGQQYALGLQSVQRVVRMVEITPLPKSPEVVLGVVDLGSTILPVLSMRKRFGRPEAEIDLNDQLIVAETRTRTLAVAVSSVTGVIERTRKEITQAEDVVPGVEYVEGITRLGDGLLFIHDLDRFLSVEEESELQGVLSQARERG